MDAIVNAMKQVMEYIHGLTGNYGVTIIVVTALIRVVLLPFTLAQTRSSQKMQEIDPLIKKLQKEYKDDPERMNKEQQELWKKHGINPFSSCLLLLIQFPFIIAFFRMLQSYEPLKTATFLIWNLGQPDPWILPILAAVTTFLQVKVSSPGGGNNPQNQTMLIVFPLLIGWMSRSFAAGLSLYWVVSNVISIGERFLVPKSTAPKGESAGR